MLEIAPVLRDVLESTGFLSQGRPAASSVVLPENAVHASQGRAFLPDVSWRSSASSARWQVHFKYVEERPANERIGMWQQEVWNEGYTPLFWIVAPDRIELYNGYGVPQAAPSALKNRLGIFQHNKAAWAELNALAGRMAMETGHFWRQEPRVKPKTRVDRRLLDDLGYLERDLVQQGLELEAVHGLIGRSIFAQYLIDREIVSARRLQRICGHGTLPGALRDGQATASLFRWFETTFNGDMFPARSTMPDDRHLNRMADFLDAHDPRTGQRSLFPYRFDVIPVELISAIYEQFVHSDRVLGQGLQPDARETGVFYTPTAAVSLILDEVLEGLTGDETVADLTCGSGLFLVAALRRLVKLKANQAQPSRSLIRSVLHNQIFGIDISETAVQVAAFSLYLAALELEPDPPFSRSLGFKPLVERTLLVGNALEKGTGSAAQSRKFDVIVGNPPWSFLSHKLASTQSSQTMSLPRSQSFDFVERARAFAHDETRFGLLLNASPFFGRSQTGRSAVQKLLESFSPLTLINLSNHASWLFPRANMPAMALLAGHRKQNAHRMSLVQVPWTPASDKNRTLAYEAGDTSELRIASWKRNPELLKAGFMGRLHDLLLLDDLAIKHATLKEGLAHLGTSLRAGLTRGRRNRPADMLYRLPLADSSAIQPFALARELPLFKEERAERPRTRGNYKAPLVLVKEFMQRTEGGPRLIAATARRDVVYLVSCYGASFSRNHSLEAHLLTAILSSAVASWYFLMTASTFGLWMQRLLLKDVAAMPVPDLKQSVTSASGKRVLAISQRLHASGPDKQDWHALDEAVFDLYQLDKTERWVVQDGLFRASWQWEDGRLESAAPAAVRHLRAYATAFLSVIDPWLALAGQARMRAEVYDGASHDPLRIMRLVLEPKAGSSQIDIISLDEPQQDLIKRIGARLNEDVERLLVGARELRLYGPREAVIVKPAARRHWLTVHALEDARAVLTESQSA